MPLTETPKFPAAPVKIIRKNDEGKKAMAKMKMKEERWGRQQLAGLCFVMNLSPWQIT